MRGGRGSRGRGGRGRGEELRKTGIVTRSSSENSEIRAMEDFNGEEGQEEGKEPSQTFRNLEGEIHCSNPEQEGEDRQLKGEGSEGSKPSRNLEGESQASNPKSKEDDRLLKDELLQVKSQLEMLQQQFQNLEQGSSIDEAAGVELGKNNNSFTDEDFAAIGKPFTADRNRPAPPITPLLPSWRDKDVAVI